MAKSDPLESHSGQTENARKTYLYDKLRAPFYGVLDAGWSTFALVIAIRYFDASENVKAFIAGAGPMGFLLTPITLYIAAYFRVRSSTACFATFLLAACLLSGATIASSLLYFTLFTITSQMAAVQQGTLMLQIYAENYPSRERGNRLTIPLIIVALSAIAYSLLGGHLLDVSIGNFRWLYLIMIISAVCSACFVYQMPSQQLSTSNVGNPWQNLSLIWKDSFFGYLLGSWMLLGLGNLITMPIRVEYLANPSFGVNADNTTIAFLLLVIPSIARVASTYLWGRLFDRLNLITTRNLLNVCFLLSIALFFFTKNIYLLSVAMAFVGISMGGGKIIWSLWVTKIAPENKASSYMSVHMALTGLRGSLAPFIGYWILSRSSSSSVFWVAIVGMILIGISIFLFEQVRAHPRIQLKSS